MKNVAIIGAGELGSRHLQALALLEEKLSIYVIDPIEASLERSKNRFEEVDHLGNKQLHLATSVKSLPSTIEFAVIATNSLQRLAVLKELLSISDVKYLILEKFLFPKLEEYDEAVKLISEKNVDAYVNCARRAWPIYKEIKRSLNDDAEISVTVTGANWNMASNSIHFLDLLFYLSNENEINIDTAGLNQQLLANKRMGYIEFSGKMSGVTPSGNQLCLTSFAIDPTPIELLIKSNNRKFRVDESTGVFWEFDSKGNENKKSFKVYRQSELTHTMYEQLIETNTCDLVSFRQSVYHHITLLKAFNKFLGEREGAIT